MAKKPYAYAQLEGVAQEMRRCADMVFFYEYEKPVATSPAGDVLDLVKEFGPPRTSGPAPGERPSACRRSGTRRTRSSRG